jgi:hypothetical protein
MHWAINLKKALVSYALQSTMQIGLVICSLFVPSARAAVLPSLIRPLIFPLLARSLARAAAVHVFACSSLPCRVLYVVYCMLCILHMLGAVWAVCGVVPCNVMCCMCFGTPYASVSTFFFYRDTHKIQGVKSEPGKDPGQAQWVR